MSVKKILVIGGAGFIGVNAVRHFAKKDLEVAIFDNFSRKGTEENVETLLAEYSDVKVIRADIVTDVEQLKEEVQKYDVVLHLAAQVAVTTSIVDPKHDFELNLIGTFNVLEAIRESKNHPMLLYASTNKVYGALEEFPVREAETRFEFEDDAFRTYGVPETQQLDFHSPYGCSKGGADQYVIDYARIYKLKTIVFRQSCIYGEHQFGVEDQGWVAWFSIAALLDKPITFYGTGKQVRDVLFVGDLCLLYEKAIEKIGSISGRAYNIGGGPNNTSSLIELMETLRKELGYARELEYGDVRAGDQPIFVADVRKAKRDIGWEPTTSVEEGVDRLLSWLRKNEKIIRAVLEK